MTFSHVVILPKDQIDAHRQSTWELSYIIRGEGMRTIGNKTEPFTAGEIVLVLPEMLHQWSFMVPEKERDAMIENISISFPTELITNMGNAFDELKELVSWLQSLNHAIQIPGRSNRKAVDILQRMEHEDDAERVLSLLQLLMTIWKDKEKRNAGQQELSKDDKIIEQAINYIHCNFKRQITIKQLSVYTGQNSTCLCTLFRRKTGKTIIQYIIHLRMETAGFLLKRHDMSISQICYHSGFRDVPYFNRTFKKHMGMSPKEYRKHNYRL